MSNNQSPDTTTHTRYDDGVRRCGDFPTEKIQGRQNVLLMFPADNPGDEVVCHDTIEQHTPEETIVIGVTSNDIETTESRWRSMFDVDPKAYHLSTTSVNAEYQDHFTTGDVKTIMETDVTGVGLTVSNILTQQPDETDVVVCFDVLTELLEENSMETVFRFLHIFTSRVKKSPNVTAHYHLDPTEFDNSTIGTLMELFDVSITHDGSQWRFKTP